MDPSELLEDKSNFTPSHGHRSLGSCSILWCADVQQLSSTLCELSVDNVRCFCKNSGNSVLDRLFVPLQEFVQFQGIVIYCGWHLETGEDEGLLVSCVSVLTHLCGVHVCACTHGGQRTTSEVVLSGVFPNFVWDKVSHWPETLLVSWYSCPVSIQGPACLCPPSCHY